jgi:uncharacterized protein
MQKSLTEAQFQRLEELLDEPVLDQAMRLDEAQGYLCAALSGPQPVSETDWLSQVLGSVEAGSGETGREAADLLRLLAAQLQTELASGEPPLLVLYEQDDDDNTGDAYVPWCQGYLHGIDSAAQDWFETLGADDDKEDSEEIAYLDEQLFPLFMLTGGRRSSGHCGRRGLVLGRGTRTPARGMRSKSAAGGEQHLPLLGCASQHQDYPPRAGQGRTQ